MNENKPQAADPAAAPYQTAVDYILGITREIWEERGVGPALARYYAEDVILRAPGGLTVGNQEVIAATLQTLHEFPDRRLIGEDVIHHHDKSGFISSHRLASVMTHAGAGAAGAATGRVVRMRVIADCVVRDGKVTEEWLIRDYGAVAAGLGLTAQELARRQLQYDLESHGAPRFFTPAADTPGSYVNFITTDEEAQNYARGWQAVWQEREPAALRRLYREGACVFAPGGARHGHDDLDRFVVGYLAAFPGARFTVEHLMINRDPGLPARVAMRWSLEGRHGGWGSFGAPTGAPIYIMGLTHAQLVNGRVAMEWMLIDETAVWKQVLGFAPVREEAPPD